MGEEKNLDSRWRDFRRHPAVQAAAVYIGAGWAIVQAADIFVPNPDVVRWLGVILAVGFLVVVGGGERGSRPPVKLKLKLGKAARPISARQSGGDGGTSPTSQRSSWSWSAAPSGGCVRTSWEPWRPMPR